MSILRLGKVHLHWCHKCNLPLIEKGKCNICWEKGDKVKITPPGDVRPAFKRDIELIKKTIDQQWGENYSDNILSENKIILLNSSPSLDRMDEVIIDGKPIGNLRYNVLKKGKDRHPYEFILRTWKSLPKPNKNYVIVDKGAVKPIKNGGSVLAPGIVDLDDSIKENDEVIILSPKGNVLASGAAQMSGVEMKISNYGKAVKNRWRTSDYHPRKGKNTWDDVLKANNHMIKERVENSVQFIKEKVNQYNLPIAVAYSGGKDSLATLHLLLDAGFRPDMLFIDTGIELPETIENVEEISKKYDLNLYRRKAKNGYWNNVDYFGPSARDYRWCCKTCKLGPTARLIKENYDNGILSFIGQRRYESIQRMKQGNTWDNPWVPGQKSASPIQDWTALHVWLYLFMKEAKYNPIYEEGFKRIGCWLCPASDLAELELIKDNLDEYPRFEKVLKTYAKKMNLPTEWIELGLWRWINIPDEMMNILDDLEIDFDEKKEDEQAKPSLKEILSDINVLDLLKILDLNKENILKEGEDKKNEEEIFKLYIKSNHCVDCGICISRCPNDALSFDDGLIIDKDLCTSCKNCLGKCPVVEFDERVKTQYW